MAAEPVEAAITAIELHLPEHRLTNHELAEAFPEWPAERIEAKTGIVERRIAAPGECASDLAAAAATRLFESGACGPDDIDFLLLCTQCPDYVLPTTACLLQTRLGLRTQCGALDVNLGCSGFVYGLGLAKGLIETGQARRVLLLTAETYSKLIHPADKSVRTLFGDGAAATLVEAIPGADGAGLPRLGPFVYGTDGRGAPNLIVPGGGFREPDSETQWAFGPDRLYMQGGEVFAFTLRQVPKAVTALLSAAGCALESVDRFVFHQANGYMLETLREKIGIAPERFILELSTVGNTVSATIPIALRRAVADGRVAAGQQLMLVGFGVGYSWGAVMARWCGKPE